MTGATPCPAAEWRCRPRADQELLLVACLAEIPDALTAWQRWCASSDLDAIDEESLRLLPLAWHRLQATAPRDRTLDIAKGVYRRAWYRNQLAFRALTAVLDTLANARIDAMLLKGASLATRYYPAPATRPMADVDLLVPHRDAERALGALEREGWRAAKRLPQPLLADHAHGMALVRDQANLDLHWNALWPQRRADSDDLFWGRATRAEFQGRAVHRLDPSDELFHACMHGARRSQNAYSWAPAPLVRWVVDAFMIARSADIDWERIAALAERFHARLQLLDAFGYLRASLGFPVPEPLLDAWARTRAPADELHYELALARRSPRYFPALPRFRFWDSYQMKTWIDAAAEGAEPVTAWRRLAGFPSYVLAFVKADLDAPGLTDIPVELVRKLSRRPSLLRP